jgi:predicted lipoprotein with Yx(FWY)xxD motif
MRRTVMSLIAIAALSAPALAQVDLARIGPNADRDFWCAAAFGVLVFTLKDDRDASSAANENSARIFTGLITTMRSNGLAKEDFDALVASYTNAAMDPFTAPAYTREECDAALADAPRAPAQ